MGVKRTETRIACSLQIWGLGAHARLHGQWSGQRGALLAVCASWAVRQRESPAHCRRVAVWGSAYALPGREHGVREACSTRCIRLRDIEACCGNAGSSHGDDGDRCAERPNSYRLASGTSVLLRGEPWCTHARSNWLPSCSARPLSRITDGSTQHFSFSLGTRRRRVTSLRYAGRTRPLLICSEDFTFSTTPSRPHASLPSRRSGTSSCSLRSRPRSGQRTASAQRASEHSTSAPTLPQLEKSSCP